MIKKNQKPIEVEAHLRYKCPNIDCKFDHWISLKESATKNFRMVCECGQIFKPKIVKKIQIVYLEPEKPKLNEDYIDRCIEAIIDYGFTKTEARELITDIYTKNPDLEPIELIKIALKHFGENK